MGTIDFVELEAELILAMGCNTFFLEEEPLVHMRFSREDLYGGLCSCAAVIMRYEVSVEYDKVTCHCAGLESKHSTSFVFSVSVRNLEWRAQ